MTQRSWRCDDGAHSRCSQMSCRCFCHLFDRDIFRFGTGIKWLVQTLVRAPYCYVRESFPLRRDVTCRRAITKAQGERDQRIRDLNAQHRKEMEAERAQLDNLLPKLIKVTGGYQRDKFSGRFTVMTALSEDFVYQVLSGYARDNRAMDYVGERMAYDIVRQIRTIDFSRVRALAEFDNGHRERISWMNPDGLDFPPTRT